jgi:hypothetical protein
MVVDSLMTNGGVLRDSVFAELETKFA